MALVKEILPFETRGFSVRDVFAMVDAGILRRDERVELIEGTLVAMSPKHAPHELIKRRLNRALVLALPQSIAVSIETTLYLSGDTYLEPDILLHDDALASDQVKGADVLLAVEIADTSLAYDLRTKASVYARHWVRHLWVIEAHSSIAHVHSEPSADGYGKVEKRSGSDNLVLPFDPAVTLRLRDLLS